MSTITIQASPKVIEGIILAEASGGSSYRSGWGNVEYYFKAPGKRIEDLGLVECVEGFGGEGQGDQAWVVIKITFDSDESVKYYKKSGYYSSYDGTDWDGDLVEVTPKQKLVTVFE